MNLPFGRTPLLTCLPLLLVLSAPCTHAQPQRQRSESKTAAALQSRLDTIARRAAPATFGIFVEDLADGATWGVHAQQQFPMMSMFKAPVAAAVLARVDAGALSLEQGVTLHRADVEPGSAVPSIGDHFRGETMSFTVRQLLTAAVGESDNTAVDALIKLLGGPAAVTTYLRGKGIAGMHVDEDERSVGREFDNLGGGTVPPAAETAAQRARRLRGGYDEFMADPRNRSTPAAAGIFLEKLWTRQLLSPASTQFLLQQMYAQTFTRRLRGGLPANVRFADKTGTSSTVQGNTAAYNDIGLLTWPSGHTVVVAAYLYGSPASEEDRDHLFADVTHAVVSALGGAGR